MVSGSGFRDWVSGLEIRGFTVWGFGDVGWDLGECTRGLGWGG